MNFKIEEYKNPKFPQLIRFYATHRITLPGEKRPRIYYLTQIGTWSEFAFNLHYFPSEIKAKKAVRKAI